MMRLRLMLLTPVGRLRSLGVLLTQAIAAFRTRSDNMLLDLSSMACIISENFN